MEDEMKGKLSRCRVLLKHNDTKEYDGVEECEQFHAFLISAVHSRYGCLTQEEEFQYASDEVGGPQARSKRGESNPCSSGSSIQTTEKKRKKMKRKWNIKRKIRWRKWRRMKRREDKEEIIFLFYLHAENRNSTEAT
jgi:hypothetical protein